MNLKDLLSTHTSQPSLYSESQSDISSFLPQSEASNSISDLLDSATETTHQDIYYLPTLLTPIQKELIESIIHIFAPDLKSSIEIKRQRNSINSLLEAPDAGSNNGSSGHDHVNGGFGAISGHKQDHKGTSYNNISLFFGQLSLVDNHPSLLVDHLIPKKLLLSEINSKLAALSGKYQLFNRIIDSLIEKSNRPNGFHLLVIAQSIKELELIEGIIIGKDLHYKNLSSSKLYDDNQGIPDFKDLKEDQDSESSTKSSSRLGVYLITSSQLYNHYTRFPSTVEFNLIFSFDSKLDISSPSIELLKSRTTSRLPITVPIPLYSLSHLIKKIPEPEPSSVLNFNNDTTNPLYKWKLQILNGLVFNRSNLYEANEESDENFYLNFYGRKMDKFASWVENDSNEAWIGQFMNQFDQKLDLRYSDDKLIESIGKNYAIEGNTGSIKNENRSPDSLDYNAFKKQLVEAVNSKLQLISEKVDLLSNDKLLQIRKRETERQLKHDLDEETIASEYKRLKKLNDEATSSEKKLGKVDAELLKIQEKNAEVQGKLAVLQDKVIENKIETQQNGEEIKESNDERPDANNSENGSEEKVEENQTSDSKESELFEQQAIIAQLKQELSNVTTEYDKLNEDNDSIRQKYQNSSAEAVQLSIKLGKSVERLAKVETKIDGPGMKSLPSFIKKDTMLSFENDLEKLKRNNDFLNNFYKERLESLNKERQTILESSLTGSNSRPTNRISRGSTPL